MKKNTPISSIESEKIKMIKEYLMKDQNVLFAVLFGSVASALYVRIVSHLPSILKASDIDIGIYFKNPPEGLELLEYITAISELVNEDLDIVVLNKASPFLKHQIMKNRVILVMNDRLAYRQFREQTISDYQEYRYISGMDKYA
ncbi:MAG: nucleotidyltransferase domain-containing protein [Nitrospirae bacterium]|nr:nucleotidyltransferase domain-containing protein [Nitrospirota bacterium]